MKHIQLRPLSALDDGCLTVGDEPVIVIGALHVYELISAFEDIKRMNEGSVIGRYKHVAVDTEDAYAFDIASLTRVAALGPYTAIKEVPRRLRGVQPSE